MYSFVNVKLSLWTKRRSRYEMKLYVSEIFFLLKFFDILDSCSSYCSFFSWLKKVTVSIFLLNEKYRFNAANSCNIPFQFQNDRSKFKLVKISEVG